MTTSRRRAGGVQRTLAARPASGDPGRCGGAPPRHPLPRARPARRRRGRPRWSCPRRRLPLVVAEDGRLQMVLHRSTFLLPWLAGRCAHVTSPGGLPDSCSASSDDCRISTAAAWSMTAPLAPTGTPLSRSLLWRQRWSSARRPDAPEPERCAPQARRRRRRCPPPRPPPPGHTGSPTTTSSGSYSATSSASRRGRRRRSASRGRVAHRVGEGSRRGRTRRRRPGRSRRRPRPALRPGGHRHAPPRHCCSRRPSVAATSEVGAAALGDVVLAAATAAETGRRCAAKAPAFRPRSRAASLVAR